MFPQNKYYCVIFTKKRLLRIVFLNNKLKVVLSSQGNQGPPGTPGPVGAPGAGLQGEKVQQQKKNPNILAPFFLSTAPL